MSDEIENVDGLDNLDPSHISPEEAMMAELDAAREVAGSVIPPSPFPGPEQHTRGTSAPRRTGGGEHIVVGPEHTVRIEDGILWVGLLALPFAKAERSDHRGDGDLLRTRRALVPFENGWGVTIRWSDRSFSSNHDADLEDFCEEATTVEVGILDKSGALINFPDGEHTAPYMPVAAVLEILDAVARWDDGKVGEWPAALWQGES